MEQEIDKSKEDGMSAQQQEGELNPPHTDDTIAVYETKLAELNDKYLRIYSEFDNYRKRTSKEKLELLQSAGEDVYRLFLPVLDDFERAIKLNENTTEIEALKEGFKLIHNKVVNTITQKGIKAIDPIGEVFNPDLHEAITNIPAASEDLKGKVVDVVEKGYSLNGKVIRFSKVVVGN